MSITKASELVGMKAVSEAVATTLRQMREHAIPGMSTKALDDFGARILSSFGARPAPKLSYGFPGCTCISVNNEIAHGIPSSKRILKEGDLVNIDVSAELNGFWSDNGGSFVLGRDIHHYQPLVDTSRRILLEVIDSIKGGVRLSDIGRAIEIKARRGNYKVIRNLSGHGIGRKLHEDPEHVLNYYDKTNRQRFKKNSVVAIETFIATDSSYAVEQNDGWTLVGNKGGVVAQHEHTIVVTDNKPIILTASNAI